MYENQLSGVKCPKCGGPITYNGNYYCQGFTQWWEGSVRTCDWALNAEMYDNGEYADDSLDRLVRLQIRRGMGMKV